MYSDYDDSKMEHHLDVFYSGATWIEVDRNLMSERANLIKKLKNIQGLNVHAEFIYNKTAKAIYPDLMGDEKRSLSDYFELLKSSRIIVINKSLSGGAISWRVGECLALGKVFIHEHSVTDFYETKYLDKDLGVFYHSEDLVEKIKYILENPEVFKRLQLESKRKFNDFFSPNSTAEYLISSSLNKNNMANQIKG
jgi:hypothetical protein